MNGRINMGESAVLKEIGLRAASRRKDLGYTQEYVSEAMDVSVQMVSNFELGKKAIRPENLIKLCDVLDISADYLLTGKHTVTELTGINEKLSSLSEPHRKLIEQLIDALCERENC